MFNHVVRALAVGDDVSKRVVEFSDIGTRLADEATRRLGIGADRGERLPDLVSERSGQRREGRDPADVGQFLPQVAGLLFGALAFRYVANDRQNPIVTAHGTHFVVPDLAGDRHEVLVRPGVIRSSDTIEQASEIGCELGWEHLGHVAADEVLGLGQQEFPVLDVAIQKHPVSAHQEDPIGKRAEDCAMPDLDLLLCGDVERNRQHVRLSIHGDRVGRKEDRQLFAGL